MIIRKRSINLTMFDQQTKIKTRVLNSTIMENSSSKMESMKPLILKAGIPLALSLAGFIIARIASQQSRIHEDINQEPDPCETLESSLHVEENREVEEEIFGLKRRIEAMQDRKWQLEKQFLHYQDLKDHEMVLMERVNKMVLETNKVEFLMREISFIEETSQRFEDIVVDHLNLSMFLETFKSENGKLHKRVKKLLRKNKEQNRILSRQSKQIQCKEMELELKGDCIREMKLVIERLQWEKNALSDKLKAAEESKEELIQLRWSNHELTGKDEEQHNKENIQMANESGRIGSDNEVNRCNIREGDSYFGTKTQNCANSRMRKLITKFKRWMDGCEKEKHRSKCFPRHSVSDKDYVHATN